MGFEFARKRRYPKRNPILFLWRRATAASSSRGAGGQDSMTLVPPSTWTLLLLLVLSGVMVFLSIAGQYGFIAQYQQKTQLEALQTETDYLKKQEQFLSAKVEALKNNPATIEFAIRHELGFVGKDELIYYTKSNNP